MGMANCKEKNHPDEYVEGVVCQESDLKENEMKVCSLGEHGKVLVVKQNGKLKAVGTKCSHYGAPLVNGALGNGRVRCPWHGACFNLTTGDIEDFPGLDGIPCYNVMVEADGGVKVRAKKTELTSNKKMKEMSHRDHNNSNVFVIVGAGAAGLCCAETLRQEGYSGRLVVVSAENHYPYDRVKLSKQLDATAEKLQLRPDAFFKEYNIEMMLGTRAVALDSDQKEISLSNGSKIKYNSIFLATGAKPRKLDLPGSQLKNIFTLRSVDDASSICKSLSPEANVLIYGSSFIGMEVASYCVGKVNKVVVVGRSQVPFQESFGKVVGERVAKLFFEKGVELRMGVTLSSLEPDEKGEAVASANLSDGTKLACSAVLMGVGSTFSTDYLASSSVSLNPNGSVPVNQFLETSAAHVFAGGDIADAPVFSRGSEFSASIGHWQLAHYHGRIAALNMMGQAKQLHTVPFFWTMMFGTSFRYAGYGAGYDDIVYSGDVDSLKFVAYYCLGEKVIAVLTVASDPVAAAFAEWLAQGKQLSKSVVKEKPSTWHTDSNTSQ